MFRVYRYDNGTLHKIPKYECITKEECYSRIAKLKKNGGWNNIQLVITESSGPYSSKIVEIINPE